MLVNGNKYIVNSGWNYGSVCIFHRSRIFFIYYGI